MSKTDVLIEILAKLDDKCDIILAEITLNPKGIGFNALYKKVRKHQECKTMARSTLSEHLKHLQKLSLIDNHSIENSNLKFKPTLYQTSQYFRQLTQGRIAQSTTLNDILPYVRAESAERVADNLLEFIKIELANCLIACIQAPEDISRWNMHQAFYLIENLMIAYRERILEKNEQTIAVQILRNLAARENGIQEKP